MITDSSNLLEATLSENCKYVADALDKAHMRSTNPLTYNSESSFQSAIGLAYFYANIHYTIIKELPSGNGYADVAFIPFVPNIPALVVELKKETSAESAVQQIKDRKYDDALRHYRGNMLFVAISYSPKSKKHSCVIEKITM